MIETYNLRYLAEVRAIIFCHKVVALGYGTHTVFISEAATVNIHDPI